MQHRVTYAYWRRFLYSNALYGIAAVLLALEAAAQLQLEQIPWSFYVLLGAGTIAFYNFSYRYDSQPQAGNRRAQWITQHTRQLYYGQWLLTCAAALSAVLLYLALPRLPAGLQAWLLGGCLIFPGIALLYYGFGFPGIFHLRLRQIGWLKPFVISAVWVGCTAVVPLLLNSWQQQLAPTLGVPQIAFLLHGFMYIVVLCILFDIKDYAADHNQQLKTFVVRAGFKATVYYIVLPLLVAGTFFQAVYLAGQAQSLLAIGLQLLPMLLLLWVTLLLRRHRSIDFYLLLIDGLMLVKAICGILAAGL